MHRPVGTGYGRALPVDDWLKGRDASWLAVPPFLLSTKWKAPLGCFFRGNHPLDPTCLIRLSSGDCLRARSLVMRPIRASTIPDSLAVTSQILVSRVAGLRLSVCVRRLRPRRTASRRPPERRAGVAPDGDMRPHDAFSLLGASRHATLRSLTAGSYVMLLRDPVIRCSESNLTTGHRADWRWDPARPDGTPYGRDAGNAAVSA
jgi:hypothetical protein